MPHPARHRSEEQAEPRRPEVIVQQRQVLEQAHLGHEQPARPRGVVWVVSQICFGASFRRFFGGLCSGALWLSFVGGRWSCGAEQQARSNVWRRGQSTSPPVVRQDGYVRQAELEPRAQTAEQLGRRGTRAVGQQAEQPAEARVDHFSCGRREAGGGQFWRRWAIYVRLFACLVGWVALARGVLVGVCGPLTRLSAARCWGAAGGLGCGGLSQCPGGMRVRLCLGGDCLGGESWHERWRRTW